MSAEKKETLLMKYRKSIAIGVVLLLAAFAGGSLLNQAPPQAENMVSVSYENQLSADQMYEAVKLMSEKDNGRVTGFEGEKKTAAYISDSFKKMGLEVDETSFPVIAYECTNMKTTVLGTENKLISGAVVCSYSQLTPKEGITAELISVGAGFDADYSGKEVTGKIALIERGGEYFRLKVARAYNMGAVGAIFYDPNNEEALMTSLGDVSGIPAVFIKRSEALALLEQEKKTEKLQVNILVEGVINDSSSQNVIATLKAKNNPSGKQIILGAHFDGVTTPAANDNASGVATILEIAKVLSNQKKPLTVDVKFIAFGAEEIGLIGSQEYVGKLSSEEKKKTLAMLNFDMVGVGETVFAYSAFGRTNNELVKTSTTVLKQLGYTYEVSELDQSDHVPFAHVGIPAIYFQMGPYSDYHTDKDNINVIEKDALLKAANLGASTCKALEEEANKQ